MRACTVLQLCKTRMVATETVFHSCQCHNICLSVSLSLRQRDVNVSVVVQVCMKDAVALSI